MRGSLERGKGGVLLEALAKFDGSCLRFVVTDAKDARLMMSKHSKIKVAHRGLLFEWGGLGWFERTHLSVVRVALISRPLPSSMAPSSPIGFIRLRKDARLIDQKHPKNKVAHPRLLFEWVVWAGLS